MKAIGRAALGCALCAFGAAALAAAPGELQLGAGVHYSEGTYGTGSETTITAFTFTARYEVERWTLRASVPYLFISGSDAVVPGIGRVDGARTTSSASGLGDVTFAATYAAYYDQATRFGMDLTGKVKLATADKDERLGTGENDLGVLAELFKGIGALTAFAGIGYTEYGASTALRIGDAWNYTLGASYRLDPRDSAGVSYDERERLASGAEAQKELTLFYSRRLESGWRAQAYLLFGFADGSPDWGAGLSASHAF